MEEDQDPGHPGIFFIPICIIPGSTSIVALFIFPTKTYSIMPHQLKFSTIAIGIVMIYYTSFWL